MNIYQKLIEVRKCVPYLQKTESGPQFKYVSSSQVLANVKAKMDELSLLLVPSVTGHKVSESVIEYIEKDKYGNEKPKRTSTYFTELDLVMTWVNAENPEESIPIQWYGQGVDIAGEKGVGKALTYAEKYFMLKFFNIPTDKDDPDSFQKKHEDEEDPEPPKLNREERIKNLIELAKKKGYDEKSICTKAKITEIKYIKNEQIDAFYVGFEQLPDKKIGG